MTTLQTLAVVVAAGVVTCLLGIYLIFKAMWRIAEPNEALIISGFHAHSPTAGVGESMGFKIVTGKGVLVWPGIARVRRLSLDANETELFITCVTAQGIAVSVKAVVIYKVGDDFSSISNAARRFLDKTPAELEQKIKNVFEGHLRSIVGVLKVEDLISNREMLTEKTREHSGDEMQKLGLVIDSLQIKEIDDNTGYIKNLAAPHAAEVTKLARIAQALSDREATEQEQQSVALKAAAIREAEIKKAGYQAEIDTAQKQSQQAGPLAEQMALQQVVVEQTKVAELQAQRTEQDLLSQVRKPADAEAYKEVTLSAAQRDARIRQAEAAAKEVELAAIATAQRTRISAEAQAASTEAVGRAEGEATRARGLGEGDSIRAQGVAQADAIKARADALAQNQEAVINQQLAEHAVDIVAAAARPVGDIDNLVVFNGTDGIHEMVLSSLAQGFEAVSKLRQALAPSDGGPGGGGANQGADKPGTVPIAIRRSDAATGNGKEQE
jgi:uncharacterized membrane protein YqiK